MRGVLVAIDPRASGLPVQGVARRRVKDNAVWFHAESIQTCRAQWLRGRASDSGLREPGFESCAAVLKSWASLVFHSTLLQFTQQHK